MHCIKIVQKASINISVLNASIHYLTVGGINKCKNTQKSYLKLWKYHIYALVIYKDEIYK